jgi:hypothetical protein
MKIPVQKCAVPANTMLENYSTKGAYVDCYQTEVPGPVSFSEFIFAFYTTPLFKLERFILKLTVAKPSTDLQARQLADGSRNEFAAWHVENRNENELLMCDFRGHTRSWLMVDPIDIDSVPQTDLYFGSAVAPVQKSKLGEPSLGRGYQALLGFHKVYSVLLLYSSELQIRRSLRKSPNRNNPHKMEI